MENPFIASNGVLVARAHVNAIHINDDGGGLNITPDRDVALREFYQAEEDERLGRTRVPEYPDIVIYDENIPRNWATFVDQTTSKVLHFTPESSLIVRTSGSETRPAVLAARLYFERKRKPLPTEPGEYGQFRLDMNGNWYAVSSYRVGSSYVEKNLAQEDR